MKTSRPCRACKEASMEEVLYSEDLTVKGVDLRVEGLLHWACPNCHAQLETAAQIDHNGSLVQLAYQKYKTAYKREKKLLLGDEIRRLRTEVWGITQKQAALIFGGGPTAFTKYESEDVTQSLAMDKLLRVAEAVPEAFNWLAGSAGEICAVKPVRTSLSALGILKTELEASIAKTDYKPIPHFYTDAIICANEESYKIELGSDTKYAYGG